MIKFGGYHVIVPNSLTKRKVGAIILPGSSPKTSRGRRNN